MNKTIPADKRILSVDVLRSFDKFCLIGGTAMTLTILKLLGGGIKDLMLHRPDHE